MDMCWNCQVLSYIYITCMKSQFDEQGYELRS
jgi:hypothetical protein